MPAIASMNAALRTALALSLGAAVSLGLARFSYALMLPAMRADLGWSYLTAGAMNTVNAAGYLAGALLTSHWLRNHAAQRVLTWGSGVAGCALIAHGLVADDRMLYALRFVTGVASAATFITGGLLAARLAGPAAGAGPKTLHAGLALGIYYGGIGSGIVASALLVPMLANRPASHGWQAGWLGLGIASLIATVVMGVATRDLPTPDPVGAARVPFSARPFAFALVAYLLFGLGYIGYMTFVVTLLRELQLQAGLITVFYIALGVAGIASSWLWARLLQRFRGGESMSLLTGLVALATVLPVLSGHPVVVFASGALFGGVFLSVVASSTALVRHNLAPDCWPGGIAAFTIVFAAGQIAGPSLVGWVADSAGGLRNGFAFSAAVLAVAAAIASRQKALAVRSVA